jgi:hypothetical protein
MKENVITVEPTKHIMQLLRGGPLFQNGIVIPSKKIVGYAEDVIEIFYITRPFPLSKFVELFG